MFIELTDIATPEGLGDCYVNINWIISFTAVEKGCTRVQFDGAYLIVSESYEQVKELIKNEVAAERGC